MEKNYSIIIPHKNIPHLLQRCLDSIPRRDDVQIIVVDDNSDPSIVDFDHFPGAGEKCVEVYFTKEGKGAGYARNIGLQHAVGKWILFADADDYYINNAFSIIDKLITDDLEILYFNITPECKMPNARAYTYNMLYEKFFQTKDENYVKYGCWVPWNKIISHQFIIDNDVKFDEIPVGNDAMFSLKVSKASKNIQIVNDKLYVLTDTPNSITFQKRNFERKFEYLKINIRINHFMLENDMKYLCINLLGFRDTCNMISDYGVLNTLKYIFYCIKKMGFITIIDIAYRNMVK